MKRKLLTLAVTGLMAFGGTAAVAVAGPGPNGNNEHGLCTAYFNGQKAGHDRNGNPGPFQALEDASNPQDQDGDGEISPEERAAAVYDFCVDFGIGGNPDHGRYDCSTDENGDTTCTSNPAPGNSGGNGPNA